MKRNIKISVAVAVAVLAATASIRFAISKMGISSGHDTYDNGSPTLSSASQAAALESPPQGNFGRTVEEIPDNEDTVARNGAVAPDLKERQRIAAQQMEQLRNYRGNFPVFVETDVNDIPAWMREDKLLSMLDEEEMRNYLAGVDTLFFPDYLKLIRAVSDQEQRDVLLNALFSLWIPENPMLAMEQALLGGSSVAEAAIIVWSGVMPSNAEAWIFSQIPGLRAGYLDAWAEGQARAGNIDEVTKWYQNLNFDAVEGIGRRQRGMKLVDIFAHYDKESALEFANYIGANVDVVSGRTGIMLVGTSMMDLSTGEIGAFFESRTKEEVGLLIRGLAIAWLNSEQEDRVYELLTSKGPELVDVADIVEVSARTFVFSEPDLAFETAKMLREGPRRDVLFANLSGFYYRLNPTRPEEALQFVLAIDNRDQMALHFEQIWRDWHEADPDAAEAYLGHVLLPEEIRQLLAVK